MWIIRVPLEYVVTVSKTIELNSSDQLKRGICQMLQTWFERRSSANMELDEGDTVEVDETQTGNRSLPQRRARFTGSYAV